ncbi:hypothetical protein VOLCADRAFT_107607 [Volvox carteri f. nagariensis]|uniref:Activator of Hsp90 ATPase AHSA1-like N-terminal domain-containing protein n=1 Tax=Volvox carteri f. nagariensis TaxID=3068 RepID=D8UF34_VOLCA|nr:uncharacterized protein VOLCADRAFT_107607 [Volvox carteri f. nagariensis]EFJ41648.1 hypothetical protein VOLCADRAFT_107607 [Volvox carteri f. nagariensis]|eukprot:XP_002957304.1 hypothetical protein VOLCADRAFT_107607 [Volvox carteri f. nagariensis]
MAKWGEGDPRWLVEHRDDGKNVNGWHWEEKDRKEWTKTRLAELFSGLVLHEVEDAAEGEPTRIIVERLKDMTGDASITTRKGNKRFAVFDLTLALTWEGLVAGGSSTCPSSSFHPIIRRDRGFSIGHQPSVVKGDIRVEEVHSTGDEDDYVYSVTVEGSGAAQTKLRSLVASDAIRSKVYGTIAQCVRELREQA